MPLLRGLEAACARVSPDGHGRRNRHGRKRPNPSLPARVHPRQPQTAERGPDTQLGTVPHYNPLLAVQPQPQRQTRHLVDIIQVTVTLQQSAYTEELTPSAQLGIAPDIPTLARDDRVRAEIQNSIDAVNQRLARIEQIKRFAILDRELTQTEGELTPTLKVKRNIINNKFADIFDGLYTR